MQFSRVVLCNKGSLPHYDIYLEVCGVTYYVGELQPKEKKEIQFLPTQDSCYTVESYRASVSGMLCSMGKVAKDQPEERVIELTDSLIRLRPSPVCIQEMVLH